VRFAGNNQVVAINKGERDGMQSGTVLALLSAGARVVDKTDARREPIQLPDERNGLGMVFRTFDRVSYVLVMEVSNPVQVGDKLINPAETRTPRCSTRCAMLRHPLKGHRQ
jgi:hypothetical protein